MIRHGESNRRSSHQQKSRHPIEGKKHQESFVQQVSSWQKWIQQNPLKTIATAAACGMVIGWLIKLEK